MKYIVSILAILLSIAALWWWRSSPPPVPSLTGFAQCLADKKVTMYGAEWCPHCQNQKKLFGDAWKFIPYVECPQDPKRCIDLGIKGYPTWIFADGTTLEGEQSLATLDEKSGCRLPSHY